MVVYTNTDKVALVAIESHLSELVRFDPDVAYARRARRELTLYQELIDGRRMTVRRDAGYSENHNTALILENEEEHEAMAQPRIDVII